MVNAYIKKLTRLCSKLFFVVTFSVFLLSINFNSYAKTDDNNTLENDKNSYIALINVQGMILPGKASYINKSLNNASQNGAKFAILKLDTPGGLLASTQEIIKKIFDSKIPVIVFVTPSGATATSAGVFITLSGDLAVMSKGTSIGAAHPVMGTGQDVKGDMRKKIENMTIAMIKSIAETRSRNVMWAKDAVKKSISVTATKAQKENVIDFIAKDIPDLLGKLDNKVIKFKDKDFDFKGSVNLPIKEYKISLQDKILDVLSNPSLAVLLWLGAIVGLGLELYHPGVVLPGLIGGICLILAMIVNQVIPISVGALLLIIFGFILIGAELYVTSGLFGIFGVVAVVLGSMSLVDLSNFPELQVNNWLILPSAIFLYLLFIAVAFFVVKVMKKKSRVGIKSLIGAIGTVTQDFEGEENKGTILLDGASWSAVSSETIKKGDSVIVVSNKTNLILEVVKVKKD